MFTNALDLYWLVLIASFYIQVLYFRLGSLGENQFYHRLISLLHELIRFFFQLSIGIFGNNLFTFSVSTMIVIIVVCLFVCYASSGIAPFILHQP